MTTPICPACGSVNVVTVKPRDKVCNDCGHEAPAKDFKKHAMRPEVIGTGCRHVEAVYDPAE